MERFSNIDSDSSARSKYSKSYFGNYLGIVVQNNDPEKRGRLKVFVPHVSSTVYANWDSLILKNKHKTLKKQCFFESFLRLLHKSSDLIGSLKFHFRKI